MHTRAAAWLEAHGRLEAALGHLIACKDWPSARLIVRAICEPFWQRDLHHTLLHWFEQLPRNVILEDPELSHWYIQKLFTTGQVREALTHLDTAHRTWMASGDPLHEGYALNCRSIAASLAGATDDALRDAYRTLRVLPLEHRVVRMRTWTGICEREFLRGNDELAYEAYKQAEACRQYLPPDQRWWTLQSETTRINQYAMRGQLCIAERLYREAIANLPAPYRDAEGQMRSRLAAIYLAWNDLDRAQAEIDRVVSDLDQFPWHFWSPNAWLVATHVNLASGRHDRFITKLDQLFDRLDQFGESHAGVRARALRAQWWIERGELLLASAWGDQLRLQECPWAMSFGEVDPALILIQLRVAQQDDPAALGIAQTRTTDGRRMKRYAELVPLLVWQAALLYRLGREGEAAVALQEAIRLARPGQFARAFFPSGLPSESFLPALLPGLAADEAEALRSLLGVSSGDQAAMAAVSPLAPGALPAETPAPGLSRREEEVLFLLKQGMANRDIAGRLFISERTVKKHVANMFHKLGVDNRTAAVVRARALGL